MKTLKKIINDEDLHHAFLNAGIVYCLGNVANVVSNGYFKFDLNRFHTIKHLAMGVGLGTLAYRKSGKGVKGVLAGLIAGTLFNCGWELLENKGNIYAIGESPIDTITDVAAVYAGNILSFLGEKAKSYVSRKRKKE